MFKNYFKIAIRNVWKSKAYSFINIFGLAIGMAVAITIGLWVHDELTYNNYFANRKNIAQVYQSSTYNSEKYVAISQPRPLEKVLRNTHGDYFKHIVMSSWNNPSYLESGNLKISKSGSYMQEGIIDMLDLTILKGARDGLKDINSIMLSASTSEALFGNEDPIGKIIKLNSDHDVQVTAVYSDIPKNNTFHDLNYIATWDLFASADWVKFSADQWGNSSFQMFVQIADNTTFDQVNEVIKFSKKDNVPEDQKIYDPKVFLLPMEDWYLRSNFEKGVQTGGRIEYVWLFSIVGAFVLLLACINFMNLSTARSEKRAKEVGIRKSIGSSKLQLVSQFLGESSFVVIMAYIFALVMVFVSLKEFNTLASKDILFPWDNTWFWLISILFILITSLLSGSYPALYLASFDPIKALKGTFKIGKWGMLPRKLLVITQFTVSITLIIGTVLVMRQIQYTKNRPVGYNKEHLIQIRTPSSDFHGKTDMIRDEFIKSGAVVEMAASSSSATSVNSSRGGFSWDGKPVGFQENFVFVFVSHEYAKTLGMKILEGRDFSRDFPTDSSGVILNRTAVSYMGLENPVGAVIQRHNSQDPPLKVIGVVDDVIVESPYEPVKQTMYVINKTGDTYFYLLSMNPNKSVRENLVIIENAFKKNFPNLPFEYEFVDELYAKKFASEERVASLASVFTVLAILISCLGLFGLASFVAEQRTKEIGVRKVLGASIANITTLLSLDFLKLIVISLLIASPLAWWAMETWLEKYTFRVTVEWWVFVLAGGLSILVSMATVSYQSIRAAIANPVKSLKTE